MVLFWTQGHVASLNMIPNAVVRVRTGPQSSHTNELRGAFLDYRSVPMLFDARDPSNSAAEVVIRCLCLVPSKKAVLLLYDNRLLPISRGVYEC